MHHRLAAGLLVAAGHQRIERERVAVGHGARLLHESAQHTRLGGRERALLKIVAARAAVGEVCSLRSLHFPAMSGVNKNIVILISGSGSNMAAIVETARTQRWQRPFWRARGGRDQQQGRGTGAGHWAKEQGIANRRAGPQPPTTAREAFDAALMAEIDRHRAGAGGAGGLHAHPHAGFRGSTTKGASMNIHPSLLPAFPGLKTHQRAIEMGCKRRGRQRCTA